jgi:hypothetical protein
MPIAVTPKRPVVIRKMRKHSGVKMARLVSRRVIARIAAARQSNNTGMWKKLPFQHYFMRPASG